MMTERQELVITEEYEAQPIDEETINILITFIYTGTLGVAGYWFAEYVKNLANWVA